MGLALRYIYAYGPSSHYLVQWVDAYRYSLWVPKYFVGINPPAVSPLSNPVVGADEENHTFSLNKKMTEIYLHYVVHLP